MRDFELTVLFRPDLDDLEAALDRLRYLIVEHGGKIIKEENDGKKRLSYRIMEYDYAFYYFFVLELPADEPSKICHILNVTDEVLRYLLVTVDTRSERNNIIVTKNLQTQTS